VGSTSFTDTGVAAGVNHTYTVSAIDAAANESAGSAGWTGAATSDALSTSYTYG
jgi:fibronectin type 3 domain-containing protein